MSLIRGLVRQWRQNVLQTDTNANKPDATIGAVINGANVITGTLGPAWVWVTPQKGDNLGPSYQAINRSMSPTFGTPVRIGVNSQGQPEILGVSNNQIDPYMSGSMGGSLYGQGVAPHSHEFGMGNYDLVNNRRLWQGLIWWRSVDGPYVVFMNEYWYFDASGQHQYYPGGTLDLTLLLTVASGQHQWIKLGFDPIAGQPVAKVGTPVSAIIPLQASDLSAISFTGYIPLRGVQVTYGQAISGEGDFTDCSWVRSDLPAMPRVLFSCADSKTVASTAAETSLIDLVSGSQTLVANQLGKVGRMIRMSFSGYASDTGTPTIQLKFKLGSTIMFDTGLTTLGSGFSNKVWHFDGELVIQTAGASGKIIGQGKFYVDGTTIDVINTSQISLDTTVSQLVDCTWQWGTSSASNTSTMTNGLVEVIN